MTDTQIFEPEGRSVPFAVEGEGPVSLVLLSDGDLGGDGLSVISHYLVEEAGFHVVRIGSRGDSTDVDARVDDVVAVLDHLGLAHTWIGGYRGGRNVAGAFVAAHTDRSNGLLLLGVEEDQVALAPLVPVLIIQGSDDEVTPPSHGERLQATAPERASVKNLDGAGHDFPLTHPIQTAFIIEEYLDWD
ncbi:alpha/beta fold hydrolase [Microbacterium rhizomatis]|uniref:Alpha/beta hydrolase n=1 Tax=Microbacterium rhizomatis TaxID=1631477 RepID=A0A5J5J510_9MICO|nr:alpha/beta hydrolase [Microbacterium rhizomatis]KAA9110194.1 alpha/beta hydrolase [Microbacterium rhizomatis]